MDDIHFKTPLADAFLQAGKDAGMYSVVSSQTSQKMGIGVRVGPNSDYSLFRTVGTQKFLLVRKSKIRKFLDSFRNRESAHFRGVPVRKSQIRKSVMINPQNN